jgi:ribonucleoside-diphosphate reductase alpha chain
MEILQPTWHYEDLWQLYVTDYLGKIKLRVKDTELIYDQAMKFMTSGNKDTIPGGELEEGMTVYPEGEDESKAFTIEQVIERDRQPETSLCSLGGLVTCNIHDDHNFERAMYHTQRMINYCIMNSTYPFPQIEFTAKKRMNAGIGMLGLATCLARKNFRYDSIEGMGEIHRLAERHMYFAIKCSIQLGKELGNAPWINRTKWPEGWLPIDTYNKSVDEVCKEPLHYDWEELRASLIANKGMRFSSLVAHMPTESSSKSTGCPNGVYPIRELFIGKSDATNTIDWTAPDSDLIGRQYQLAYDIDIFKLIDCYSVLQKLSDQTLSADLYMDRRKTLDLSATQLIKVTAHMQRRGMKTRYYVNSRTDDNMAGNLSAVAGVCTSGACTL